MLLFFFGSQPGQAGTGAKRAGRGQPGEHSGRQAGTRRRIDEPEGNRESDGRIAPGGNASLRPIGV